MQDCNVAKVLQLYASGRSETGKTMAARATHLLQRWQLTVYQLTYEYDEDGMHEVKQRELRRKLEVLKNFDPASLKQNADASVTLKDDELIRKAPNGRLIMYKSNFDFLEKPESHSFEEERKVEPSRVNVLDEDKKGKHDTGKTKITQLLTSQKRSLKALRVN